MWPFQWKRLSSTFLWLRFIMLYKVVLTFESVDEIFQCDHSNESYWAVLPVVQFNFLFKLVLPIEFLDKIQVCNYLKTTAYNIFFAEMKVKLSFTLMMHLLLLVFFNSRKCIWRTKNRFLTYFGYFPKVAFP